MLELTLHRVVPMRPATLPTQGGHKGNARSHRATRCGRAFPAISANWRCARVTSSATWPRPTTCSSRNSLSDPKHASFDVLCGLFDAAILDVEKSAAIPAGPLNGTGPALEQTLASCNPLTCTGQRAASPRCAVERCDRSSSRGAWHGRHGLRPADGCRSRKSRSAARSSATGWARTPCSPDAHGTRHWRPGHEGDPGRSAPASSPASR